MGSRKEKKDKKDKKSKKLKKDKKSSKANKQSSSQPETHETLSNLLSYSLLEIPQLMTDLPMISKSLDNGEYIDIANISDENMRNILQNIMKYLPVLYNEGNGWYKETQATNISNYILKQLQTEGSIKLPNELTMSETISSKNVTLRLMILLKTFPELKLELEGLFHTLLTGNSIQVDDLDNEDIRDNLEDIFHAIGLVSTKKDGFSIPEGKKEQLISEILELMKNVFNKYQLSNEYWNKKSIETSMKVKNDSIESDGSKDSDHNSSNSDDSSSSDSEGDDIPIDAKQRDKRVEPGNIQDFSSSSASTSAAAQFSTPSVPPAEAAAEAVVVKGPSMPTIQDLQHARTFIEQQQLHTTSRSREGYASSSEDDEAYGPQVCDARTARIIQAHASMQPLGFAGGDVEPAFERAFAYDILGIHPSGDRYTGEAHKVNDETQREEWILTPGDSKLAGALSGTGLTNRKFQAGKQAKKLAEQMSIQREFQRQQQDMQLQQEGGGTSNTPTNTTSTSTGTTSEQKGLVSTQNIMNNYNEKRKNLSLMDEHLAKRSKTTTSSSNSNSIYQGRDQNGQLIRRGFDREKDLLSSNRMDEGKIKKLVQNAKELDEKFDKAFVQKSFL